MSNDHHSVISLITAFRCVCYQNITSKLIYVARNVVFLDTVDIPYYWKAIYGTSLVKKCIKPYTPHLAVNGAINARYLSWLV